ncbi:hypothetical protein CXB51_002229 [Gossypium anomalum]|uniref:Legume lectin domain-containing protein n=1 Tax=Gossypium anomalum TaxID=47600 RepID=A0A8J6DF95_9ROSI|nr:hypothetical protein CXB51_002229 [Gossypium anomalum]
MRSSPLPPYFLILLVFLIHCSIQVSCFRFNISTFEIDHIKQLILSNSYIVVHTLQVTPDLGGSSIKNTSGRAVYKKPFRLWKDSHTIASFNTTFVFVIQNRTSPGGEGLAFIIAGDSTLPPNSEGRWLGILNSDPNGSPVVAVEFDTRKSDDQDLDDNHIGLDINSINSNASVSLNHFGFNISGGLDLWVLLQYDGQNLTVRGTKGINIPKAKHTDLPGYGSGHAWLVQNGAILASGLPLPKRRRMPQNQRASAPFFFSPAARVSTPILAAVVTAPPPTVTRARKAGGWCPDRRWRTWQTKRAAVEASTAAPLCSLSCNENGAKTLKEPILPKLTECWLLGTSVLLKASFHPTASSGVYGLGDKVCDFHLLHCNFKEMGDKTCNFNLSHCNFRGIREIRFVISIFSVETSRRSIVALNRSNAILGIRYLISSLLPYCLGG